MIPGLSETSIHREATASSFQRGREYFRRGAVDNLVQRGDTIQADVEGSDYAPYQVTIVFDAGGIRSASCTCPYDYEGWCKHIVAVALTCLHQSERIESRPPISQRLVDLNRDQLIQLIQALVAAEPALYEAIEQQMAQNNLTTPQPKAASSALQRHTPVDAQSYRRQVSRLISGLRHMHSSQAYWHVGGAVNQVSELLGKAQEFLAGGDAENALTIFEAVVDEYIQHWFEMDDSDGEANGFFDSLDRPLTEILLSAELPAKERQRWLSQLDRWANEVEDYGVDEPFDLAREVLARASTVDQLITEGHVSSLLADLLLNVLERRGDDVAFLQLAQQSGQNVRYTQKLVTLGRIAEAMRYALAHFQRAESAFSLAQTLRQQAALSEALAIGERGLALAGEKGALATWLRDLAQSLGKGALALTAARVAFQSEVELDHYRRLQELAGDRWPSEREAALEFVRKSGRERMLGGEIDVLLHEKLVNDAIALVDRKGVYYGYEVLAQVVEAAIPVQPDWAIRQSLHQANQIIQPGKADIYHHAVEWLRRARDAWCASGRTREWQSYLDQLRNGPHGRKYKLMGLLDGISR
jgi:uncharacterized Zn finger protein